MVRCFQVPAAWSEETLVLELLEQDRVLVHPGYFFDFPHEAFLVLSLLPEPERFLEAVRRVFSESGKIALILNFLVCF